MSKPDYERIYLVPEDGIWCWPGTPAPGAGQSNADAVEYVRADLYHALAAQVVALLDDHKEFVKKEFQLLKEIERLEIELKKRDEQNAALAAQVEALRYKLSEVVALLDVDGMTAVQWLLDNCPEIESLTNIEIEQHLAEIRAQAVESAIKATPTHKMVVDNRLYHSQSALLQYAARIRQEVLCEKL